MQYQEHLKKAGPNGAADEPLATSYVPKRDSPDPKDACWRHPKDKGSTRDGEAFGAEICKRGSDAREGDIDDDGDKKKGLGVPAASRIIERDTLYTTHVPTSSTSTRRSYACKQHDCCIATSR